MSMFGHKKESKHDENDVRILQCLRWTHPDLATVTEAEIKERFDRLYPTLRQTFVVSLGVANAAAKGLVGTTKDAEDSVPRFYITRHGAGLITPKKKKEK
ncbi:MAG: hypothetical protein Q8L52_02055 [bacterium]|nr:hypothetical protein [bacterium]